MDKQNRGGRPKSYSVEQLDDAIEMLEGRAEALTAENVKSVLCDEFGISRGINLQSLGVAVEQQVEAHDARRLQALRSRLPAQATAMAADFAEKTRISVLDTLSQQYDDLCRAAGEQVDAKEFDNAALRWKMHDLADDVASKSERISNLEAENEELQAAVAALEERNAALEARLAEQGRDEARMEELIARMVAVLGQEGGGTGRRDTIP